MNDALSPPTPQERLEAIAVFIEEECCRRTRAAAFAVMTARYPEQAEGWLQQADDAERALAHVEALRSDTAGR